ncbi:MAG: nitrate reductase delta subunit [Alphaproteobacteria bacterium]|jgi:nitrate reductase delta subunit
MAKTFKVLSALLSYPTAELQAAVAEFGAVLVSENLVPKPDRQALEPLIAQIAEDDLYDLQERYVLLFDRTRSLSLHIFEHIHGESRDRGQAMIDLAELYHRNGMAISARELPDYLPLFLEFLSTQSEAEARELLEQPLHIISALATRLMRRESVYAAVLRALEAIARSKPEAVALQALLDEVEDDPNDLAALDAIWEEEAVTFGPGAMGDDNCPNVSEMLARMGADPVPSAPVADTKEGSE